MKTLALPLALLTTTLALSPPVQAAGSLTRTFVSSAGSDSNPCTVTQPCATFAAAYNAVASEGIVAALDPGKYGPLTITGPVTIDGNGWAAITAPTNNVQGIGIAINAGPNDNVILRGLLVDGAGQPNTWGINFTSGALLAVIDCVVRNMTITGLNFGSSASTLQTLSVSDSYIISSITGISVAANSSGNVTASIDRTVMINNDQGGLVVSAAYGGGAATAAVTDSVSVGNQSGFAVETIAPSTATLTVTRSQAIGNETGWLANGTNATMFVAQSSVTGGTYAFQASSSAVINSYGDNYITNAAHIGSLTPVSKQ